MKFVNYFLMPREAVSKLTDDFRIFVWGESRSVFGAAVTVSEVWQQTSAEEVSSRVQMQLTSGMLGATSAASSVVSVCECSVTLPALGLPTSTVFSRSVRPSDAVMSPYSWANLWSSASFKVSVKCRQELSTAAMADETLLWTYTNKTHIVEGMEAQSILNIWIYWRLYTVTTCIYCRTFEQCSQYFLNYCSKFADIWFFFLVHLHEVSVGLLCACLNIRSHSLGG